MSTSYTDQLAAVKKAIKQILETGQSVTYNGRTLTMANLTELRNLEKQYEALAANEGDTPARNRVIYVTPIA